MNPLDGNSASSGETHHAEESQPPVVLSNEQVLTSTKAVPADSDNTVLATPMLATTVTKSSDSVLGKRSAEKISSDDAKTSEPSSNAWDVCDSSAILSGGKTGAEISEKDAETINKIAADIKEKINNLKKDEKEVFLHFGIGVGNPDSARENPTAHFPPGDERFQGYLKNQVNPGFLKDAIENGYYVIALNINSHQDPNITIDSYADPVGLHGQVEAYFPLSFGGPGKEAWSKLHELTSGADWTVVMSCIDQLDYKTILDFVPVANLRNNKKSVYIKAPYKDGPKMIIPLKGNWKMTMIRTVNEMPKKISELYSNNQ